MMLKSSSTPILSSMLSSKEITDFDNCTAIKIPESKHQVFSLGQHLTSPLGGSSGHADTVRREDLCLQGDVEWDFESHVVPWPSIRKVQSETHLLNFGRGFNSSVKVAADGLLNSSTCNYHGSSLRSDGENSSIHERQWSRRTSLRRHSSLPANISQQDFAFSDHALFKLPEVKEFLCTGQDAVDETESTLDDQNSKARCMSKEHDGGRLKDSTVLATKSSNLNSSAEEDPPPRNLRKPNVEDFYVSNGGDFTTDCQGRAFVLKQASAACGRKDETALIIDGERYTSTHVGADGVAVACNSRGCRPLSASEATVLLLFSGGLGSTAVGKGGKCIHEEEAESRSDKVEEKFIKLLEENPGQPLLLRNYAHYLVHVRKDYAKAEEFFERAILEEPGDGELLSDYAKLIWQVHGDEARAGSYFKQSVQAAPDDCHVMAAYASFLWGSEDANQDKESFQISAPTHESETPITSAQKSINDVLNAW